MKIKIRYTLLISFTLLSYALPLSFTKITTQSNQDIGWLKVNGDAVLIRLKPKATQPIIKPLNFQYVIPAYDKKNKINDAYSLPAGLFYWKKDKNVKPSEDGKIWVYDKNKKKYLDSHNKKNTWKVTDKTKKHPPGLETAPLGTFKRSDFFKRIMGENEQSFLKKITAGNKPKFPKKYDHGTFYFESIETLNKKIKTSKQSGTLNIIEGRGTPGSGTHPMRYILDVGAAQADKNNKSAMFQLASNFHFGEARMNPEAAQKGNLTADKYSQPFVGGGVEEIIKKAVQGEEAAISAAPGLIYKMYYATPHNALEYYNTGGNIQDSKKKIYTLCIPVSDVGKIDYRAGHPLKAHITDHAMKRPANPKKYPFPDIADNLLKDDTFIKNFIAHYKVGYLNNVQVTGGLSNVDPKRDRENNYNNIVTDKNQKVHQVFSCGLDLNRDRGYDKNYQDNLARLLLYATYEGALKAAWSVGAKKLYLTTVGTGDFKNKKEWVAEALKRLQCDILKSGIDVYLVIFDNKSRGADGIIKEIKNNILGGTHTIYDQNYKKTGDETVEKYKLSQNAANEILKNLKIEKDSLKQSWDDTKDKTLLPELKKTIENEILVLNQILKIDNLSSDDKKKYEKKLERAKKNLDFCNDAMKTKKQTLHNALQKLKKKLTALASALE